MVVIFETEKEVVDAMSYKNVPAKWEVNGKQVKAKEVIIMPDTVTNNHFPAHKQVVKRGLHTKRKNPSLLKKVWSFVTSIFK
jgi:hypothetical protein